MIIKSFMRTLIIGISIFSFAEQKTKASSLNEEENKTEYAGLSIDGGGMKATVSAKILAAIEDELQAHSNPKKRLYEVFDYIGGTSAGGLLTLAMTAPGAKNDFKSEPLSLEDYLDLLKNNKHLFLPKTRKNYVTQFWECRYSPVNYEKFLNEHFGGLKLSNLKNEALITSTELETMEPLVFSREASQKHRKDDYYLKDVARVTTSTVSQYPASKIFSLDDEETRYLVDGAVCFNNTSQFVFDKIQKKWSTGSNNNSNNNNSRQRPPASIKNIYMLSIGGNFSNNDTSRKSGMLMLAPYVVNHFAGGAVDSVNREMKGLLKDNYQRIVPGNDIWDIKYDDTSAAGEIKLKSISDALLNKMSWHKAPKPNPGTDEIENIARRLLKNKFE